MKSIYYITNDCAVNHDFARQLTRSGENDQATFINAAPGLGKDYSGKTVVYLSTNGDPTALGTWEDGENIWSILDEESAEDATEDYPNTAGFLASEYGIESLSDFESLLMVAGLLK